jgi:hypothetical protein
VPALARPLGRPPAARSAEKTSTATTTHIIHPDHVGGTNVGTDADGAAVQTLDYYPFGAQRINTTASSFSERR